MRNIAECYYNLGLTPTCISYLKTPYNISETNPEKSPCHAWRRWQVRRPNIDEIINLQWENSNGIGAVLGYTSRCIDIDNCTDLNLLKEMLLRLRLPENYEWAVKSPNGFHIHIKSSNLPFISNFDLHDGVLALNPNSEFTGKFKQIELRWANHIVLPPTKINGIEYEFIFNNGEYPKNKPQGIQPDKVFSFISKYCGGLYGKNDLSGGFMINDVYFSVAFPSEYPASLIFSYKILNHSAAFKSLSNDEKYKIINHDRKDAYELNGVWNNMGYRTYEDFGYYTHFIEDPLFLDIETTGLISNEFDYENYPRIIQIAFSNGYDKPIHSYYIKPDKFEVPENITKLTGITTNLLKEKGMEIGQALGKFNSIHTRTPIITFNTDFDIPVLDSEFIRLNKNRDYPMKNYFREGSQIFCLMKKFNSIFGGKYAKLSEVYSHFFKEAPPIKTHNATNDLELLIDCYYIMDLYGYINVGNKGRTLV